MKEIYIKHIAARLELKAWQVENCVEMFADGDTIPFISRYRKEKTGGMDDAQVAEVRHWADVFDEMEKRKETVLKTIGEAGALTDELRARIEGCVDSTELEDLYLPWRPKRRTRATAAREKGLEPLADALWDARPPTPQPKRRNSRARRSPLRKTPSPARATSWRKDSAKPRKYARSSAGCSAPDGYAHR